MKVNTVLSRKKILLRAVTWVAMGMAYIVPNVP